MSTIELDPSTLGCLLIFLGPVSFAFALMHPALNYCSPVSFLQLKSSSLLAASQVTLILVLAIYYYRLSGRMAYETTTQVTHGTSALLLHLIATRYPHNGEVSAQELELYRRWAMPEFLIFVDASEFYLPAIDAAVDLRDFKTAAAREDHDSDVQTLRVKIGEYRAFYNNMR
ncbi:hypothetical protein BDP27DRAFT_1420400 [Rhodocollybia butyracea]|uniref:Uncharacterized protein n=1 Tax=Rhodocollybia butyracea TaxID=206335 RepID=A0A9P5U7I7_9AGAR|nr:hypothetical protein BDP27DRAFT_1420400 [Rhodocollybia butyracea]